MFSTCTIRQFYLRKKGLADQEWFRSLSQKKYFKVKKVQNKFSKQLQNCTFVFDTPFMVFRKPFNNFVQVNFFKTQCVHIINCTKDQSQESKSWQKKPATNSTPIKKKFLKPQWHFSHVQHFVGINLVSCVFLCFVTNKPVSFLLFSLLLEGMELQGGNLALHSGLYQLSTAPKIRRQDGPLKRRQGDKTGAWQLKCSLFSFDRQSY